MLLRAQCYGPPVDLFAMGAIMAELFTLRPLFPGSTEVRSRSKLHATRSRHMAETLQGRRATYGWFLGLREYCCTTCYMEAVRQVNSYFAVKTSQYMHVD